MYFKLLMYNDSTMHFNLSIYLYYRFDRIYTIRLIVILIYFYCYFFMCLYHSFMYDYISRVNLYLTTVRCQDCSLFYRFLRSRNGQLLYTLGGTKHSRVQLSFRSCLFFTHLMTSWGYRHYESTDSYQVQSIDRLPLWWLPQLPYVTAEIFDQSTGWPLQLKATNFLHVILNFWSILKVHKQ